MTPWQIAWKTGIFSITTNCQDCMAITRAVKNITALNGTWCQSKLTIVQSILFHSSCARVRRKGEGWLVVLHCEATEGRRTEGRRTEGRRTEGRRKKEGKKDSHNAEPDRHRVEEKAERKVRAEE